MARKQLSAAALAEKLVAERFHELTTSITGNVSPFVDGGPFEDLIDEVQTACDGKHAADATVEGAQEAGFLVGVQVGLRIRKAGA